MASVTVTVNGRAYQVNCSDGQEGHVARMGRVLDHRAQRLAAMVGGTVNETTLLVMAGILLAEEMAEAKAELERQRHGKAVPPPAADEAMAAGLERLAERIDAIAESLEKS